MLTRIIFHKLNPEFRKLTELLFFSNQEIDVNNYKKLLKSNYNDHIVYFWDLFRKSSNIHWDSNFWNNRISFIFSLKEKSINYKIEDDILKKFQIFLKSVKKIDTECDIEYLQFLALCKAKENKTNNLKNIKLFLCELIYFIDSVKLTIILKSIFPNIFKSFNEYFTYLCKIPKNHIIVFKFFKSLESKNIFIDRKPIVNLVRYLLGFLKFKKSKFSQSQKSINNSIYFILNFLSDDKCLNLLKKYYDEKYRESILEKIKNLSLEDLDSNHYFNIKNLIKLDENIADHILPIYLNLMYNKKYYRNNVNVKKIISLTKQIPQFSIKKIISWLSSNYKNKDIKLLISKFPEYNKLMAFV